MRLSARIIERRLVAPFVTARGVRRSQRMIRVEIEHQGRAGVGEASGIAYRGETPEAMLTSIEGFKALIERGISRRELISVMQASGARSAVDAALWDLESRPERPAFLSIGLKARPEAVVTATTISLAAPVTMARRTLDVSDRKLLKVKLGRNDGLDIERARAVRKAAPEATLIADGNCGCHAQQLPELAVVLMELDYKLLEQPLPPGSEEYLRSLNLPIPLCADESLNTRHDIHRLNDVFQYGNIKLDKSGGLTEALSLADAMKERGIKRFVGCMLGGTVSIAPAFLLTPDAQFVDLDGPLWMAEDSPLHRLDEHGRLPAPGPEIWGH
ncbi:MAG: dipeptide epimerase [Pseudomonadota bacterium]